MIWLWIACVLQACLLLGILALTLPDILFALRRWWGRIHIGRWKDPALWGAAVERAARKQSKRLPAVPLTDQTRLTFLERRRGEYRGGCLQLWHEAALLDALGERGPLGEAPGIEARVHLGVRALAALRGGHSAGLPWIQSLTQYFYAHIDGYGTMSYDRESNHLRLVDTLWMVCPFLFGYAARAGDREAAALAKRQLEEYLRLGMHPITALPVHALLLPGGVPLGLYGWGRGSAFLLLALAESHLEADDEEDRRWLLSECLRCAGALLRAQLPGGGWSRQLLGIFEPEASATAMLGYAMALIARALPPGHDMREACHDSAVRARQCLMGITRRGGLVDYAQGDARGLGQYALRFEPLPLAQAYALRLSRALDETAALSNG
ncbi:MAG: glycoside hydrolase family 88 protein [Oscillospiraceae bacterium]|nr:glycoside hydrolase family 88 protein [Oscillospiraceae bacterium]